MAKGKTLAEQIAELSKPEVPDFDIEDAERVFDHDDESGAEMEEDDELKKEHYVSVSKSKLRGQQGIEIRDEKYKGKASSRSAIFGDDSGSEESADDDEEEEQSQDSQEDSEEDQESEDEEMSTGEESENKVSQEEEESTTLTDSESESESSPSEPSTDSEDEATSDAHKREKLKELMSQERKVILSRISTSTQTDALKGYAVIAQQRQFDSIIDARIKLQKSVQSSNALPLNNETFEEFGEDNSDELQGQAVESLKSLLDGLLSLRAKVFNKEKLTKEPVKIVTKKRNLEEYLSETERLDTLLKKNRENVLLKWSHKVQSASGAQALSASKFTALNQSAAQQVENHLMDMDRLVKRTRLNRRGVVPMGRVEEDEEEQDETQKADRSLKENRDIFDDEDFYRVLLNDLVDKKLAQSAPAGGLVITKTKVKKNVDTKASKGRKLKYTVQEKIQNYEAPRGSWKWDDHQIDEFFAGLFGQRVNFAESDEEPDDADDEEVKHDDLKIFG